MHLDPGWHVCIASCRVPAWRFNLFIITEGLAVVVVLGLGGFRHWPEALRAGPSVYQCGIRAAASQVAGQEKLTKVSITMPRETGPKDTLKVVKDLSK